MLYSPPPLPTLLGGFFEDNLQQDITAGSDVLWGGILYFVMANAILTGDKNHR
jgi:hypothetical protein